MKMRSLPTLFLFLLLPLASFGQADWKDLKTDHFMVFYKPGYEFEARQALRNLEYYRPLIQRLTGNDQPPLTAVVIQDAGDYSNGLTDPLDQDIQLFTEASSALELPNENWWATLCPHEYTHLCHLSRLHGVPAFLRDAFGNIFNPNLELPAWIDEGFAVYNESRVSHYAGRLNDGAFDAYLGVSAQEGHFPSVLKATFVPLEFPYDVYYEAGAGFHRYLAQTYGEEKLPQFYGDYGTNVLSYLSPLLPVLGLDAASKKNYKGKSIPGLWEDWKKQEQTQDYDYRPQGERLTKKGWSLEGLCLSEGHLYYQEAYPVKTGVYAAFYFNNIVERDLADGKERVVASTTSYFTAPLRIKGRKLYYAEADLKQGYANTLNYGYLSRFHEKDLVTGEDRVLWVGQLRGFGVLSDGNLLLAQDRQGIFGSELFTLDPANGQKSKLFTLDLLVDQIVADDRRVVVTAQPAWGLYHLYQLDLKKGTVRPLVPSPFIERDPQLVGDKVLFTADFGRKYSLYEYDFQKKKLSRLTTQGYADWPALDQEKGQLYFAGMNSGGSDLYHLALKPQAFSLSKAEPSEVPSYSLDEKDVRKGDYFDDLGWLAPKVLHAPVFQFDQYDSLVGLTLAGSDALYQFDYAALPIYDFKDNRAEVDLGLTSQFFAPWIMALEYSGIHDDSLYFQTVYPLKLGLSGGMTNLDLGLNLGLTNALTDSQFDPFVLATFAYPTTRLTALVTTPLQRVSWGADQDRTALFGYLSLLQYFPSSQLRVGVIGIEDPQNNGGVFPDIRGYSAALGGLRGIALSEDYSIPLLQIRDGLWNPSLYFQDFVLDLFSDQAFDEHGATQWSYGAEFHLETEVFNGGTGLPNDLGVRFAWNQDGEKTVEGFFTFFAFNLATLDRAPAGSGAWLGSKGMPALGRMLNLAQHPDKPLF